MSTKSASKLNQLLQSMPRGTVLLSSWLVEQGYSHDLQQKYLRSQWLTPLGKGAYKRTGDDAGIIGGIYALQKQAKKNIHIGGPSAVYLQGHAHYIGMENQALTLFSTPGFKLPAWFSNLWSGKYTIRRTSFLPAGEALITYDAGNFEIRISSLARAMMECLEMAPDYFDLEEAWLIMESLNSLQPRQVQSLLERCKSVKTKRLFLYFAEKASHAWFKHLNVSDINLGKGKRRIVKNGTFEPRYQITLPGQLV
ncbi:MAG: type IV toxin-antitoxin system AbiEi family antitoxin [Bacteroidota bacterium]|nr:type IV toxin-antitoxin system AbiEi family antitoxin [Bacteroidota bacterium]